MHAASGKYAGVSCIHSVVVRNPLVGDRISSALIPFLFLVACDVISFFFLSYRLGLRYVIC